jgi:uncharacterized protein YfaP (DUF2135 family)
MKTARHLTILLLLCAPAALLPAAVTIESPANGLLTSRIVTVSGRVTDPQLRNVRLVHNGIGFSIPVHEGRFSQPLLASRGDNLFLVQAGRSEARVSAYATVPGTAMRVFLYWDVVADEYIDLWVHEPDGTICKWNNRVTPAGGTLHDLYNGDIGRGPQYYTLDSALPGEYGFSVHYYTKRGAAPRRCHVVIVLYEGTAGEERLSFTFPLTRQGSEVIVRQIRVGTPDGGPAPERNGK